MACKVVDRAYRESTIAGRGRRPRRRTHGGQGSESARVTVCPCRGATDGCVMNRRLLMMFAKAVLVKFFESWLSEWSEEVENAVDCSVKNYG